MSKLLSLSSVNKLKHQNKSIFILIGGGSGSGKNYFASKLDFPLVDVDFENERINHGKIDCLNTVSEAIRIVKEKTNQFLQKKESFLQVSTASKIKGTENKFKLAKSFDYITVFIHINCPIIRAIKNNDHRVKLGGHGKTLKREKIILTKLGSDLVFNKLKNSSLVDFYLEIQSNGIKHV